MIGDVEHDTVGSTKLDLKIAALWFLDNFLGDVVVSLRETLRSSVLEIGRPVVNIIDHDTEMMQPDIVKSLAKLIPVEFQDGDAECSIAEEDAASVIKVLGTADFLKAERLLVERRRRVRILRRFARSRAYSCQLSIAAALT